MNVGVITKPNSKGQIVIPKKFRDELGIDKDGYVNLVLRGSGIYIYPVEEVLAKEERNKSYTEILRKTAGAWVGDNWPETRKRRRRIELAATKRNREARW